MNDLTHFLTIETIPNQDAYFLCICILWCICLTKRGGFFIIRYLGLTWWIDTYIFSNGSSQSLIYFGKHLHVLLTDRGTLYFSKMEIKRFNNMLLFYGCHTIPKQACLRKIVFKQITFVTCNMPFYFLRIMCIYHFFRTTCSWGIISDSV